MVEVFYPASTRDWVDFDVTAWHFITAIAARAFDPSKLHLMKTRVHHRTLDPSKLHLMKTRVHH
jgi:hypothetical protein